MGQLLWLLCFWTWLNQRTSTKSICVDWKPCQCNVSHETLRPEGFCNFLQYLGPLELGFQLQRPLAAMEARTAHPHGINIDQSMSRPAQVHAECFITLVSVGPPCPHDIYGSSLWSVPMGEDQWKHGLTQPRQESCQSVYLLLLGH